jgi:ParB family chromosome partitioning protein
MAPAPAKRAASDQVEIDLDRIDPNPFQPRQRFLEAELAELAASIKEHGLVQPVVVRPRDDRYQLVVGERRVRAAQRAGLLRIPAVVREVPDARMGELALVENIQRENLDPIEEAEAYRDLMARLSLTQAEVAQRVKKDRSTVSNSLRLLNLSESIRAAIREGSLAPGHGRAILAAPEAAREKLARKIVRNGLSVREAEKLAAGRSRKPEKRVETPVDPNTRAAEEAMARALATRVRIRRAGDGGKVEIAFHNEEELERIYEAVVASQ